MKCIDFDKHFSMYLTKWIQENRHRYKDVDDMEVEMPEIYLSWEQQSADFLAGKSPANYFDQYDDAKLLVDHMGDYCKQHIPIPQPLYERIKALGTPAEDALLRLIDRPRETNQAKMEAIGLLREMDCARVLDYYITTIAMRQADDDLADACAEGLETLDPTLTVPAMIASYEKATSYGQDDFLNVLSKQGNDERIYDWVLARFLGSPESCAYPAQLFSQLGDTRAIPHLLSALSWPELSYVDYMEIRNVIDALGGSLPDDIRDYAGDKGYEAMKRSHILH